MRVFRFVLFFGIILFWNVTAGPVMSSPEIIAEKFLERLRRVDVNSRQDMEQLAEKVEAMSRSIARTAVETWQGPDSSLSDKARHVLVGLEDLSVVPLLDAPLPPDATKKAWMIQQLVAAHQQVQERIISVLDHLLDDTTEIQPDERSRKIEELPPTSRVCDEAYLAMRHLLNLGESDEMSAMTTDAFLHLPDDLKDEEIEKVRNSRLWTQLVEDIEDIDEPD